MLRYYDNAPSLYETQCENGEIDEDAWRYEPVDCGDFYMIESYKYANSFPKEWAQSHLPGTGPEQCGNCYDYGSKDGVFLGYCLNCAKYDYNGQRGPGLDTFDGALEIEDEFAFCTCCDPDYVDPCANQSISVEAANAHKNLLNMGIPSHVLEGLTHETCASMFDTARLGNSASTPVSEKEEVQPPSIKAKAAQMAKLIAQLHECSRDLDYVFQIAEGRVSPDDQRSHDFFGIEKE